MKKYKFEAPEGWIYICMNCGKMARDAFFEKPLEGEPDICCFQQSQILEIKELPPRIKERANAK